MFPADPSAELLQILVLCDDKAVLFGVAGNMRSLLILCIFLFGILPTLAQSRQSPSPAPNKENATVAGNVVRLDTGEPLRKAKVILQSHTADGFTDFCLTDEQGHFLLENVPAGSYSLEVSRNGYLEADYGQKKPGVPGAILTINAGQRMTDLVFKLARAAAISGHVFDEDGEAVPKAEVIAYRASKKSGKEQRNNYEPVSTNDLGEFRIYDLLPGRYYLAVNYRSQEHVRLRSELAKQKLNLGYPPMFYPNTTDPARAQALSVGPGDEIRSVDFLLRPSHLVSVSGRVMNTFPANSPASGTVSLYPRGSGLMDAAQELSDTFQLKDGTFVIRNVPPGAYDLFASWVDRDSRDWHRAKRQLDVGNTDVEGITITISRGVDISGHLTWDGSPGGDSQDLIVILQPLEENEIGFRPQMVKSDGTFQLKNVPEGTYRPVVHTRGREGNYFLKSARYGTATITDAGLTIQPGAELPLELTMSSRAALLRGVVLNADSLPAVDAAVVLIPDPPQREVKNRYKSVTTDQNGKFSMTGITPGDYKLFSWDSSEESEEQYGEDWFDPDWLKPFETKGESVHLEEADEKSVNLTLIETRSDSPASN